MLAGRGLPSHDQPRRRGEQRLVLGQVRVGDLPPLLVLDGAELEGHAHVGGHSGQQLGP
jgi:hypothetical protein